MAETPELLDPRLMRLASAAGLRALLAVVLAATLGFGRPGTLASMWSILGAYLFADGLVVLWSSIARVGDDGGWLPLFVAGLIATVSGGLLTVGVLDREQCWTMLSIWAIATGLLELVAELRLRRAVAHETMLAWAGAATLAVGLMVPSWPRDVHQASALFCGYALVLTVLDLGLALHVRRRASQRTPRTPRHA